MAISTNDFTKKMDTPLTRKRRVKRNVSTRRSVDFSGNISEKIARFLGTPTFIFWLTVLCIVWISWNTLAPEDLRFDSAEHGFTALTLVLSLQASYAAPLILLAQNRQADRERVSMEHDRERAERNLADTEYLAREITAIRLQLGELATRNYIRTELKEMFSDEESQKP
ncbi:MAG: DUF1003 domain-containing protein [Candidatus Ancillula sp.]|jgi:uncharacterized membrane protein|nr:DUF1003 domain-containing protein [Candidatus Ancillula sp.]